MKFFLPLCLCIVSASAIAQESNNVADIAKQTRESIVVVTAKDHDGETMGLGSGFVVDAEKGLIATALHVIQQAPRIAIQTRDEVSHSVVEVFASDRTMDLAVLRVQPKALKALPIASVEDAIEDGDPVVAIGHPLGLKHSVVSGHLAGERNMEGQLLWQIDMIIEPGNSGCPLIDMQGKVQGVVVMKSNRKPSFGFAVKATQLRTLIDQPNPISIENWSRVGELDAGLWKSQMGARWRQRSGQLLAEGSGAGFGGRSLLLRQDEQPKLPFEVAVSVKLDDETGAAGLVFHADGNDSHYGFYPSGGRLRLTSFEGPTQFSWNVVREIESAHYRRDEWNEIKVRVEQNKIVGYVNGHEVVTVNEVRQPPGRIGLCKFRTPSAKFKRFRFGDAVKSNIPSSEAQEAMEAELNKLPPRSELLDEQLNGHVDAIETRSAILEKQARDLERQAKKLRDLRDDIYVRSVCQQLSKIVSTDTDNEIDLLAGAFWIAKLDNAELQIEAYLESIDAMAKTIRSNWRDGASEAERLASMDTFLFKESGYHGSRSDYYNPVNSYLDRVIDDREGLPITLSVLYMSLAKKLGLNVVGVGLPGHFVVRHEPVDGDTQLIDVFDQGKHLTRNQADVLVFKNTQRAATDSHYATSKHREILQRMVSNLLNLAQSNNNSAAMLRYLEAVVAINPDDASFRGMRGVFRHQQGRKQAGLADIDWILETQPTGIDLDQVRQMRKMLAQ